MSGRTAHCAALACAAVWLCVAAAAGVRGPSADLSADLSAEARSAKAEARSARDLSSVARSAEEDLFDEIYERGKDLDASLKTLTAHFVETSTSPLLERPLVARGTLAVVRPSRVILRYQEPDTRTVLIDGDALTVDWPSRKIRQQSNIATAQRRVQRYFIGKSPDDLRKHFKIDAVAATDRPAYLVTLHPTRKQIRESLTRLELWINREALLLDAMRMHFAGGETKTMEFSEVVINPPLDARAFTIGLGGSKDPPLPK